jgi:hypothetical protein
LSKWATSPAQELVGGLRPEAKTLTEWVFGKSATGYEIDPNKKATIMGVPMSQPLANAAQNMVPGLAAWAEFSRIANKDNGGLAKASEVLGGKSYNVDEGNERYWKDKELADSIADLNKWINDRKTPNAVKITYKQERDELQRQRNALWGESMNTYKGY